LERNQFLQVMRFVAAALVLCTHATFYYHERVSQAVPVWHFGEIGVPLFFVISGIVMVMSTHALPANAEGAKNFMLRRVIRIVPLYWIATGIKVAVALSQPNLVNHNHFRLDHAVQSFLFIPYFNEQHAVVPLHGVGWTLLHEMFFYLVFSLAMLCRQRPALVASVVITLWWLVGTQVQVDNAFWAVASSGANLNFITGMLAGSLLVLPSSRAKLRWGVGAAMLALAALLYVLIDRQHTYQSLPFVVAFGAAAVLLSDVALPRWTQPAERLGDSSYSLYLFHPFMAPACLLLIGKVAPTLGAPLHIGLAIVITIAAAHLLHLWVEVPAVRLARELLLGQRWGKKRVNSAS
jgi:exopolysaccharide production protein ExoZ